MEELSSNFNWLFTDDKLRRTPSIESGLTWEQEQTYRQKQAMLIQVIGGKSGLTQLAVNTSVVFMHRFYMFRPIKECPRIPLAIAFAFAGGKVEESARKLEHLIRMTVDIIRNNKNREYLDPNDPLTYEMDLKYKTKLDSLIKSNCSIDTPDYQDMRRVVLECETEIYAVIGFQLQVVHPHNYVIRMCALLGAENIKDISQYAYNLATASSQLTMLCLKYKPETIATMCLFIASKAHSVRFVSMKDPNVKWYQVLHSTTDITEIEAISEEFLNLIKGCPLLPSWMSNLSRMSRAANNRVQAATARPAILPAPISKPTMSTVPEHRRPQNAPATSSKPPTSSATPPGQPPSPPAVEGPVAGPSSATQKIAVPQSVPTGSKPLGQTPPARDISTAGQSSVALKAAAPQPVLNSAGSAPASSLVRPQSPLAAEASIAGQSSFANKASPSEQKHKYSDITNQPKLSLSMYRERTAKSKAAVEQTSTIDLSGFPVDIAYDSQMGASTYSPADKALKSNPSNPDLANFTVPKVDSPNAPSLKIKVKLDPSGEKHYVKNSEAGLKLKIRSLKADAVDGEVGPSGSSRSSTPFEEGEIIDDASPALSERKSEGLKIRLTVPRSGDRRDSDYNGHSGERESHRSHHHGHQHRSHHHKSKKHSSSKHDRSRHESRGSKRSGSDHYEERTSKSARLDSSHNTGYSINDTFSSTLPSNIFDDDDDDGAHPPLPPTPNMKPRPPLPRGKPPSSPPPSPPSL